MAVRIIFSLNLHGENTDCSTDYPSYELFTDTLRRGVFKPAQGISVSESEWRDRQLRLVVDRNRRVQEVIKI